MEKYIYDSNNGLWYELQGDYYIPCLTLPEEESKPIGIWGQRHKAYLKEHRKATYTTMLMEGKLNSHLADIDKQAQERLETLVEQMKQAEGITEQLKAENALKCSQFLSCFHHFVAVKCVLNSYKTAANWRNAKLPLFFKVGKYGGTKMGMYITEGIWYLINLLPISVLVWLLLQAILFISKKRVVFHSGCPKWKMLGEFLLILWSMEILQITGILGGSFSFSQGLTQMQSIQFDIPFWGSSIKMITLNVLLFVPYGFLIRGLKKQQKRDWLWAILIGLGSSFCIEFLQLFTGRLPEIDDVIANTAGTFIGFLLWNSFSGLLNPHQRKKALTQGIITIAATAVVLMGLSFVANGDKLQAEEERLYAGIGNSDAEWEAVSVFQAVSPNGQAEIVNRSYYSWLGASIGNMVSDYRLEDFSGDIESIVQSEKATYIEIIYEAPQQFRFYNNQDFVMENVQHLLYSLEDGTVYYGDNETQFAHCMKYVGDNPFVPDTDLYAGVMELLK